MNDRQLEHHLDYLLKTNNISVLYYTFMIADPHDIDPGFLAFHKNLTTEGTWQRDQFKKISIAFTKLIIDESKSSNDLETWTATGTTLGMLMDISTNPGEVSEQRKMIDEAIAIKKKQEADAAEAKVKAPAKTVAGEPGAPPAAAPATGPPPPTATPAPAKAAAREPGAPPAVTATPPSAPARPVAPPAATAPPPSSGESKESIKKLILGGRDAMMGITRESKSDEVFVELIINPPADPLYLTFREDEVLFKKGKESDSLYRVLDSPISDMSETLAVLLYSNWRHYCNKYFHPSTPNKQSDAFNTLQNMYLKDLQNMAPYIIYFAKGYKFVLDALINNFDTLNSAGVFSKAPGAEAKLKALAKAAAAAPAAPPATPPTAAPTTPARAPAAPPASGESKESVKPKTLIFGDSNAMNGIKSLKSDEVLVEVTYIPNLLYLTFRKGEMLFFQNNWRKGEASNGYLPLEGYDWDKRKEIAKFLSDNWEEYCYDYRHPSTQDKQAVAFRALQSMAPYIIYFAKKDYKDAINALIKDFDTLQSKGVFSNAPRDFNKEVLLGWKVKMELDDVLLSLTPIGFLEYIRSGVKNSKDPGFVAFHKELITYGTWQRKKFEGGRFKKGIIDGTKQFIKENEDKTSHQLEAMTAPGTTALGMLMDVCRTTRLKPGEVMESDQRKLINEAIAKKKNEERRAAAKAEVKAPVKAGAATAPAAPPAAAPAPAKGAGPPLPARGAFFEIEAEPRNTGIGPKGHHPKKEKKP